MSNEAGMAVAVDRVPNLWTVEYGFATIQRLFELTGTPGLEDAVVRYMHDAHGEEIPPAVDVSYWNQIRLMTRAYALDFFGLSEDDPYDKPVEAPHHSEYLHQQGSGHQAVIRDRLRKDAVIRRSRSIVENLRHGVGDDPFISDFPYHEVEEWGEGLMKFMLFYLGVKADRRFLGGASLLESREPEIVFEGRPGRTISEARRWRSIVVEKALVDGADTGDPLFNEIFVGIIRDVALEVAAEDFLDPSKELVPNVGEFRLMLTPARSMLTHVIRTHLAKSRPEDAERLPRPFLDLLEEAA